MRVSVPLGQYDSDKLPNIGTNRWSIKPEIGVSKTLGLLILELATRVTFHTQNDNFWVARKRGKRPSIACRDISFMDSNPAYGSL